MLRIYRQLTTLLFKAWVPFKWNLNWIFPRLSHIHPLITYLERGHVVTTTPRKGGGDLVYTISRNIDWIVHRNLLIPCETRWIHINASQNVNKFHKTGCWQHSQAVWTMITSWIDESRRKKEKKERKEERKKRGRYTKWLLPTRKKEILSLRQTIQSFSFTNNFFSNEFFSNRRAKEKKKEKNIPCGE